MCHPCPRVPHRVRGEVGVQRDEAAGATRRQPSCCRARSLRNQRSALRPVELVVEHPTDRKGPGPLVNQLSKTSGSLPVPITIVPGDLSKDRLEAIT